MISYFDYQKNTLIIRLINSKIDRALHRKISSMKDQLNPNQEIDVI